MQDCEALGVVVHQRFGDFGERLGSRRREGGPRRQHTLAQNILGL